MKSIGFRFLMVGMLTVLMFIPIFLAGEVIDARADYNRETMQSLGEEWGGAQKLSGPQIMIPVKGPVTRTDTREVKVIVDGKEQLKTEEFEVTEIRRKQPIFIYPEDYDVCLLYTSPSPRDLSTSRMPSSA